jgi:hypothetical protein
MHMNRARSTEAEQVPQPQRRIYRIRTGSTGTEQNPKEQGEDPQEQSTIYTSRAGATESEQDPQ